MSPEGKAYVEGIQARAHDFCLLSVPTVNGYRRFAPEFTLSPTRVGWSFEDRSAMVRVLGTGSSTHVENRIGEPCANPYLAIAAQLFAGLDGLAGPPSPEAVGPAPEAPRETLPQSLREALEAFRGSSHARELLGAPLLSCMTKLKESEVARFEAWCGDQRLPVTAVTEWEQREYFGVY